MQTGQNGMQGSRHSDDEEKDNEEPKRAGKQSPRSAMQTGQNGMQGSRHSDDEEKDNEDKGKEDV